jgi:hypothetical protein
MPKSRPPNPAEFQQRIIELVRKGRTPESLAEQCEPSAQPSATGCSRPIATPGSARTASRPTSARGLRRRRENKTLREEQAGQGGQDTSITFRLRCREAGVRPSIGSVGNSYDCDDLEQTARLG